MKHLFHTLLATAALLAACSSKEQSPTPLRTPVLTQEQLEANPEQLGGVYYAYPGPQQETLTPAPAGYSAVYVSHYGRHGSRYQPNDKRYLDPLRYLEQQQTAGHLTPLGQEVLERLQRLWPLAEGRGGLLSTIGEQQHHDLAKRLYARCPEVFTEGRQFVDARSSVVPRCGASMRAFCSSLQQQDTALRISLTTDSADMAYIANDSPALKALDSDTAAWKVDYLAFCRDIIHPERLMGTLLTDVAATEADADQLEEYRNFMSQLYWLAVGMQDIPAEDITLMDLFTPTELFDLWRTVNYRMYMTCGPCPDNAGIPADCARPLLSHIIREADAALACDTIAAHLRFGHDSHLLRLLALIHADGADVAVSDPAQRWQVWQEPVLSPMAANLQLIFYRSNEADAPVLVKFLLNERELLLHLDIDPLHGPYYDWEDLSSRLKAIL